ncbi:hypothetical protein [Halioglobus japonicus]|uniref:hypothetical protein n=1 Tax=Halioglobus japonicus TaxID=930805 RepID=UPI0012F50F6C|nr:hypothetical protein [Halioglobus japonicus]
MDEKYRKTDTETLVAAVSSAVSELAANDLMTGKDWLRTIKKQDLQVIKTSIEVVRTFSLQTDEILSSLERDLDPLLTENVENSVRPGKEGSLKDMQRRQPHLHMIRNLNPRNQTHAFAIVVATCHRYRNFGCSSSDYGRQPTNPESQMRKSVTTVTGGRSITHEEVPEVVAILSLYPSFEALFEDIETLSGAGLKMKEKTSSQIFFTRLAAFADGLAPVLPSILTAHGRFSLFGMFLRRWSNVPISGPERQRMRRFAIKTVRRRKRRGRTRNGRIEICKLQPPGIHQSVLLLSAN